ELIRNNVEIVISQRVGPKAFVALQEAGVKIFAGGTDKTVEATRQSYEAGELQELLAPNN
ncbi:MAG TPA: dinitrogenase iron-molybdenum cofactor biosynthesis protein, partial [Syntrophomonas sp.]|nr:dinitrogenase iron-molybdenum cofactor biosynthesis protein [Syntrophomonas sp.]